MVNCKMQMAFVGSSSSSSLSSLKKLHLHFQLYERHRLFVSSLNWKGRHNSLACSHQKRVPRASLKNLNMNSVDSITPPTKTGIAPSQSPDLIKPTNIVWHECSVNKEERQNLLRQKGCVIWITGLSGSGKSTLACALSRQLHSKGKLTYVLDGDNVRHGLNKNLSFSAEDRAENIRRIGMLFYIKNTGNGEAAKLFADAGVICIASVISPYRRDRNECRSLLRPGEFIEIYMDFSLDICENRDPKGLYKLARTGKIKGFTGIDDPYEAPETCEIVMRPINGKCPAPKEMAEQVCQYLETNGFFRA